MMFSWIAPHNEEDKSCRIFGWIGVVLTLVVGAVATGLIRFSLPSCFDYTPPDPEYLIQGLRTLGKVAGSFFLLGTLAFQFALARGRMLWPVALAAVVAALLSFIAGLSEADHGYAYLVRVAEAPACTEDRNTIEGAIVLFGGLIAIGLNLGPLAARVFDD